MTDRAWDRLGRIICIAVAAFLGTMAWEESEIVGAVVGGIVMWFILWFAFPREN